jgi:predicted membrane channel-forming protein YqfA (hemolysin III family)
MSSTPVCRGILHLNIAIILPFLTYVTVPFLRPLQQEYIVNMAIMTEIQMIASAMLHMSYNTDTWSHVFDHSANMVSMLMQCYSLTYFMPNKANNDIFLVSVIVCMVGIAQKICSWDPIFDIPEILCVAIQYILYTVMYVQYIQHIPIIRNFVQCNLIMLACMILVYKLKWPLKNNNNFGYHEIMHTLSSITGVFNFAIIILG